MNAAPISRRRALVLGGPGAAGLVTGATGWIAAATADTGSGTFQPGATSAELLQPPMVYPTLLATIGDVAHPAWRARAVGIYRLWRDGGFAVDALAAGLLADAFGIPTAIWTVAALTAASGLVVAARMYETHPQSARTTSCSAVVDD